MSVSSFFKDALKWHAAGGHSAQHAQLGMRNISYSGNTFTANAFTLEGFEGFTGGSITMPGAGTWYVGVELSTKLHDEGKTLYDLDQRDIDAYLVKFFD